MKQVANTTPENFRKVEARIFDVWNINVKISIGGVM